MTNDELFAVVKKHPVAVGCGLLSLALAVAIYFRSDAIPAAVQELEAKSTEADRYATNIKNAARLKEQLDTLVAANKEIDGRLVHVSAQGTNSQFFYKLESESGVRLINFQQTTQSAAKNAAFVPVGFTVTAQGDLPQLLAFLGMLENGTHYARVMNASCTLIGPKRDAPLTLTLTLELLGQP
ncbi:MAG TPA: hypothetical protein VHD62_06005 [Opitutaceae bacterium]|nr:hypothetical protein [Opitutaceae bacterium]